MKRKIFAALLITLTLFTPACANNTANNISNEHVEVTAKSNDSNSFDTAEAEIVEQTQEIQNPKEETSGAEEVTFTDALGREVTVTSHDRVVTLLGSFCDEWLLSGGSVVGTGSDSFKGFDFTLDESVVDVGEHSEPNIETILSLEPDFVIASSSFDEEIALAETLENAGITVAYFDVKGFDDYLESLKIFTEINGREDLYEKYGTEVAAQIDKAKEKADGSKPNILFIRAASTSVKVKGSKGTVGGEILADLDTVNIADSDSTLEDLSIEAIVAADPDYIFVTTMGSDTEAALANVDEMLVSNPAWETLSAVKNGNYYVLDKALYNSKPNARWGEAYEYLADILYQ